jgi:microcystin degradation protein MlrC
MRLFTATLATETNTFSPLPTSLQNYRESVFFGAGEHPSDAPRMCTAPLFVARARAKAEGFELIEGSCFAASPAGTTNRADYEFMRDEILGQLKAALPVDGLLLGLHGAMVAHGYDDVEGDIIERCRAIAGPKCVIGVELDPHCHLTMKRVSQADIIVLYKEFPHTDVVERAGDAARQGETGHVGLRLPADPELPHDDPADARHRRPHHGDGRQGRHPVRLDRSLLSLW